tara:strand:+ start:22089 stop:24521 length:2433 start_codon:yes stop_codon:yes gene_type:complete
MSTSNRVFVSPGVYTSEKDISFVTRQVGVTTLGLVGETTKGPAFQPIFLSDYEEFKNFFGGLNATRFSDTGFPKYELPYIAKSYFARSNQLYVTRVLGLSGYDAGPSWAITADNNQVVALLRSRATYDSSEVLVWDVLSGDTANVEIDTATSAHTTNKLAEFTITGTSTTGAFSYLVSLDTTNKNFITRVLGTEAKTGKSPIFVEEVFNNMLVNDTTISGLTASLTGFDSYFEDYKTEFLPAVTPWVVSELNGSVIKKLFRLITISDGDAANSEIKISIANIKPDVREFDVLIRAFSDTDANPIFLERFSRCTMDPTSDNFVARRIGTLDGYYASKSNYVLLELDEDEDTSASFPAGFTGIATRAFTGSTVASNLSYNTAYAQFAKVRKIYLGLSDTVGIDQDAFDYKGADVTVTSGITDGFHMDVDASGGTLAGGYTFVYGDSNFQTDTQIALSGNSYTKIYSRKFTFAPYGGFDGWDVYRVNRTNTDTYTLGGVKSNAAIISTAIDSRLVSTGDQGSTSDYYAYLEAIRTFDNPEATNINVFATPGIDILNNTNLVESTIEMVETERCDSIYLVTTPDYDADQEATLTAEEAVDGLEVANIDSSYTATYWPWVQINDTENNVLVYVPPTRDVVRNIALTDNVSFPWFAVAGVQRGDVQAIKARLKLTLADRDVLYEGRINAVTTFASDGIKIWGNKTLQVKESALDRLNVRRLLLQARKLISAVSIRLLFEQNDEVVRNQFKSLVNPILENIRKERGLTDFRVEVDNTPESIDRNELIGRIFIKPTRALEFIKIEFVVMNTGASFDDV